MKNLNNLEKSILSTIVYYGNFNVPLTYFEIWKYLVNLKRFGVILGNGSQLSDIIKTLNNNNLKNFIETQDGFYFLRNRAGLVEQRIARQKETVQKMKKLKKYLKLFAVLPFVKMICLTGSISLENLDNESDWDVFFMIKKERLYFTTLLIAFLTILLGKRRTKTKTKDKICLNYFISDQSLNIKYHSLYTANIFQRMKLAYDKDKFYPKFIRENSWISDYFYFGFEKQKPFIKLSKILRFIKSLKVKLLSGRVGDFFEKKSKIIIQNRIKKSQKKYSLPGRIIIDDFQIEYHPASPEFDVIKEYNIKMKELGFDELAKEKDSGLAL